MKKMMSVYDVANEIAADSYNSFTYSGALALAEWLDELGEASGEEMEFDAVAIRCDFSQYDSLEEWAKDYFSDWKNDLDIDEDFDEEEIEDIIRDHITDHGSLIEFDGGVIVSLF